MNLEHDLICPLTCKLCSGPVVRSGLGGAPLKALALTPRWPSSLNGPGMAWTAVTRSSQKRTVCLSERMASSRGHTPPRGTEEHLEVLLFGNYCNTFIVTL